MDGCALTLDEILSLASHGVDLSVVLIMDVSAGADALVGQPDIRSVATLN